LAERAIRLLENQSLRQAKGTAGKELYEKLFSINQLVGTLLAG